MRYTKEDLETIRGAAEFSSALAIITEQYLCNEISSEKLYTRVEETHSTRDDYEQIKQFVNSITT